MSASERVGWLPAIDPATGETIEWFPREDAAGIDRAVRAARVAFERGGEWRKPAVRTRVLAAIGDAIERGAEALAALESRDTGSFRSALRGTSGQSTLRSVRTWSSWWA